MENSEQVLVKITKALIAAIETYDVDLIDVLSKAYQRVASVQSLTTKE